MEIQPENDDKISRSISKLREIHLSALENTETIHAAADEVKQLSAPFMEQLGGENLCRTNIDLTIGNMQEILNNIKETDSYISLLKSK